MRVVGIDCIAARHRERIYMLFPIMLNMATNNKIPIDKMQNDNSKT